MLIAFGVRGQKAQIVKLDKTAYIAVQDTATNQAVLYNLAQMQALREEMQRQADALKNRAKVLAEKIQSIDKSIAQLQRVTPPATKEAPKPKPKRAVLKSKKE